MTSLDTPIVIDPDANSGVNEVQSIKVDGTAGTWTLEYEGQKTDALAFNISPANLAAELEELAGIPEGSVTVSGGVGNAGGTTPYLVEFTEELAGQDIELLVDADELTGGGADVTVTTTAGGKDATASLAVQRGKGAADATARVSPLTSPSPTAHRAANSATYGD